mgnify:CR=1 FL=1
MNLFLLFILIGLFTLAERLSFLVFLGNWEMPPIFLKALRYAPVTILFALVSPSILRTDGMIAISFSPKIIAGIAAILIAWRTRNILMTIAGGMLIFWLCQWIFSI